MSLSSTFDDEPLKSKRVPISLPAWSTAFSHLDQIGVEDGIEAGHRRNSPAAADEVPARALMGQNSPMQIDAGVNLKPYNTFGLPAVAKTLVRITSDADVRRVVDDKALGRAPKFILGGGSNIILTRDMPQVVLKVEVRGMRLVEERADAWIVEAGAGESWHDFVAFTLANGWPGLENLALIPGTVGAAPVQNIGAYGVELSERFESLDAVDLVTGRSVTLGPEICAFGYRDSVFKHSLAGRSLITRVRFRLPRPWQPVLGYLELQKKMSETGIDCARGA